MLGGDSSVALDVMYPYLKIQLTILVQPGVKHIFFGPARLNALSSERGSEALMTKL